MNVKVKTTIILLLTFIIGIFIGAMLNRAWLHNRIKKAFSWRNPNYIAVNFERTIQPEPQQAEAIRKILKQHAKSVQKIRKDYRKEMQSAFESLKKEMDAILTPEQKRRLNQRIPPPFRRFPHPPRHRPPFPPPGEDGM